MSTIDSQDKVGTRQAVYGAGLIGTGVALLLAFFKVIDVAQATQVVNIIQTVGGLLGVGATGTAAIVLGRQKKQPGVLDPVQSPEDAIVSNLPVVVENITGALAAGDRVKKAIDGAFGTLPGSLAPVGQALSDGLSRVERAIRDDGR